MRIGALAELKSGERKPHIAFRGIKFNIPLELRTPSYSDTYEGNVGPQFQFGLLLGDVTPTPHRSG